MASKIPVANAYLIYKRLFTYVRRYWFSLVVALVASLVYSGVDSWFVYFLKPLLNRGLVKKDHDFLQYAPFLVLGVFMLRGVASFFSNYSIAFVSRSVIARLRQDLFAHLQRLPAKFYDHSTSGQMLSVMNDSSSIFIFNFRFINCHVPYQLEIITIVFCCDSHGGDYYALH
jgi:ATP-binding cassette, subfamily B, bacterial MsbA